MTSIGVTSVNHCIVMANVQDARIINQFLTASADMHGSRVYCKINAQ